MRTPEPPRTVLQILRETALALPHLGILLTRLLRDPRVALRRKMLAAVAAAYVASPIDVIPDMVPLVGQLDDAIVVAFAIHHLLNAVPPAVRAEYWAGSEDALDLVQAVVAWGAELVPPSLRRLVGD
jgi:uncharacterized membrane protein YkvA (DUF1232 family)